MLENNAVVAVVRTVVVAAAVAADQEAEEVLGDEALGVAFVVAFAEP